jgi:hypothetical protein
MDRKIVTVLLTILLSCAPAWSQDKTDFSGTWKLNLTKSDYGDLQGPNSRIDTITQEGINITESVVSTQRHQAQNYTMVFSTDGRKTVLPEDAHVRIGYVTLQSISATWVGTSLVVIQGVHFEDYDLATKNTYTLSGDGETLTITLSLNGDQPVAKYVFDRMAPEAKSE